MRRRWMITLGAVTSVLVGGGLFGWYYADRTIIARKAIRDGTIALHNGDTGHAEERFSAAIRKFPDGSQESTRAHLWRAQVRLELSKHEEALADADRVLQTDPSDTQARTLRAEAEYKLGRYDEAKGDFDLVRQAKPESGIANYFLALIAERRGDWETAHAHILYAIRDDAFYARGFVAFARIVRAEGNPIAAEGYITTARERDPNVRLEIE